jgi:5-deoxy-glucuronate isomerase
MKVPNTKPYANGYNSIVEMDGKYSEMKMDFGMLMLTACKTFECDTGKERAIILIAGKVVFEWEDRKVTAERGLWKDENPWCLSVPKDVKIKITGIADHSKLAYHATDNDKIFSSKMYVPDEIPSVLRAKGINDDTACRIFRTIIDVDINPDSNFVLGEDVHLPGRWSGYPNHYHPHPEIYHFEFYPDNGFGLQRLGNEAVYLENDDTVTIYPNEVHPCVGAPGYYLYYIWCIKEDHENRYRPWFEMQHVWVPGIWVSDEEKMMMP